MGSSDLVIPATLGHYRIVTKIGQGGMGEVYRAHDERLDRDVAIKLVLGGARCDESDRRHFRKEAVALSRLNHPNIETIFDFDSDKGLDFIVTEYIPGSGLEHKIASGALPEPDVLHFGSQLADGLAAAHEQDIVHRDLKPSNLRITPDRRLKILDFGVAKLFMPVSSDASTGSLGESMRFAGTLPYMAPEQIRGEQLDARTDIWAAGVVLYEMATGQRPFLAPGLHVTDQILHQAPAAPRSVNPQVSSTLDETVLRCLEKDPAERYQSATELSIALRRLQSRSEALQVTTVPRSRSLKKAALAAGLLALLTAILIALNVGRFGGWIGRSGAARIESLAVLPLANLSGDPQQEYFADGMTEALIADLGKVGGLRVISRTSVMQYKQTRKPLPAIARELNVDALVEGSVLRSGSRVRITAQLVQANKERHLWAESYERDLSDILALQDEVASQIAAGIQGKLMPRQQKSLSRVAPVNPAAYEAYLQGRYFWNQRSREGVLRGLQYFQKAVQLDPTFALAYVGLADSSLVLMTNHSLSPGEALPAATAAAQKALSLDETLAEAHTSMAQIAESN